MRGIVAIFHNVDRVNAEPTLPSTLLDETAARTRRDERVRNWLLKVLGDKGLRASALAKRAHLSPSTITRFINRDPGISLGLNSIEKIVKNLNVERPQLFDAGLSDEDSVGPELLKLSSDGAEQYGFKNLTPKQTVWRVLGRGLDLAGYLPDDIVLVDDAVATRPRDIVCAQEGRDGEAEELLRIYEPPFLLTETTDPAWRRKPLLVDSRVTITGVVVRSARVRPD